MIEIDTEDIRHIFIGKDSFMDSDKIIYLFRIITYKFEEIIFNFESEEARNKEYNRLNRLVMELQDKDIVSWKDGKIERRG